MKKSLDCLLLVVCFITACGGVTAVPAPALTPTAAPTVSPSPAFSLSLPSTATLATASTPQPTYTLLAGYPPQGYGPQFPTDVDPLTGLKVANPALLDRRPMAIKISNEPRDIRPQWGLSLADLVFDYYTEAGETRFIAVFYDQDASRVGPIRSARFFDAYVVEGYKAVFAFGDAWVDVLNSLENSAFKNRLVTEGPIAPLTRYDPNGKNLLVVNTADLSAYLTRRHIDNGRQNLDGMFFQTTPPVGGQFLLHVYVRYSAATYDRWDYNPTTGRYYRYEDSADDTNLGQAEQYAPLTDALTSQAVAFDNVVILYVNSQYYIMPQPGKDEVMDIQMTGSGQADVFRDGQMYPATWKRGNLDVVSLYSPEGQLFPLKPGTTCFEVIGLASTATQTGENIRFTNQMP